MTTHSLGEAVEEQTCSFIAGGMQTGVTFLEGKLEISNKTYL